MNTQEAYEQIRKNFTRGDAKIAMDGGLCVYRTTDENGIVQKCAVGALIPDSKYESGMECGNVADLLAYSGFVQGLLWDVNKDFLVEAQFMHDTVSKDAGAFVKALDVTAKHHGLVPVTDWLSNLNVGL